MPNESTTSAEVIRVEDLRVHYTATRRRGGDGALRAVDGISFAIGAGERVGMVGESGCGKSTVAKVLLALQRPTSGSVFLHGDRVDFDRPGPLRRSVQMVF
jgi:oligopeptide transport system ATP-binding protein